MDVKIRVPGLEKLFDYVISGIGSVTGSGLAPWRARQEAKAKEIMAQGEANALQIIANAQATARKELAETDTEVQGELTISETIEQRLRFQEKKRQKNIESVIRLAAANLKNKDVPNKEADHDFVARFFADVQDVSSEELQLLWGRILSGKIERPESISIRSLSILKNLDRNTAKLFQKFCSACIKIPFGSGGKTHIIDGRAHSLGKRAGDNALQEYGFDFHHLNILNEHGLIISDYNSWADYSVLLKVNRQGSVTSLGPFKFQGQLWSLILKSPHDTTKEFKAHGVALTEAGRELSRIVDLEIMEKYTQDLIKFFESEGVKMVVV
jgi:hypothetical protein